MHGAAWNYTGVALFGRPHSCKLWKFSARAWRFARYRLFVVKIFFDFFERFAFGLRQQKARSEEINDAATREDEEHRPVAVSADGREKNGGDGRCDALVDQQRAAHPVGAKPRAHPFGKREPDAHTGAERIESDKCEHTDCDEPPVLFGWHRAHERVFNCQWR